MDENGNYYVSISDYVVSPPTSSSSKVSKFGIFWDCSRSRGKANFSDKDFPFLTQLFSKLQSVDVDIYLFRDAVDAVKPFSITNGNGNGVIEFLKTAVYDGGTCLGNLDVSRYVHFNS